MWQLQETENSPITQAQQSSSSVAVVNLLRVCAARSTQDQGETVSGRPSGLTGDGNAIFAISPK
jgi:hypothetical protein